MLLILWLEKLGSRETGLGLVATYLAWSALTAFAALQNSWQEHQSQTFWLLPFFVDRF